MKKDKQLSDSSQLLSNCDSNHNEPSKSEAKSENSNIFLKTFKPLKKKNNFTICILFTLFTIQLALTSFGFYLQMIYLNKQHEKFENEMSNFLNEYLNNIYLRQEKIIQANSNDLSNSDENLVVFNYGNPIQIEPDSNSSQEFIERDFSKSFKNYRSKRSSMNQTEETNDTNNVNNTIRNANRFRNLTRKIIVHKNRTVHGKNSTNLRNSTHSKLSDPIIVNGDHFFIQAYSKISVNVLFCKY